MRVQVNGLGCTDGVEEGRTEFLGIDVLVLELREALGDLRHEILVIAEDEHGRPHGALAVLPSPVKVRLVGADGLDDVGGLGCRLAVHMEHAEVLDAVFFRRLRTLPHMRRTTIERHVNVSRRRRRCAGASRCS